MKLLKALALAVAAVAMTFTAQAEKTAKVVLADYGKTLRFVYDTADYGTKGTDWFSVAEAEAISPNRYNNVPWYGKRSTVTKVVFDASFADYRPSQCGRWFCHFESLDTIEDVGNLNTSAATLFTCMFCGCTSLTTLDVTGFDTANATDMSYMFSDCTSLTELDLSGFDTANVTNMCLMFDYCTSLTELDLSDFDTANVTDMNGMFEGCTSLTQLDLSGIDTANVTDMCYMFYDCTSLTELDLSGFDTANVGDMDCMFEDCTSLTQLDLSGFDTAKVEDMGCMFEGCTSLTQLDLSGFDTANVEYMYSMFEGCTSLTQLDLSGFDTAKVEDMDCMFGGCTSLTQLDLSGFDTANVEDMYCMFYDCTSLTELDLYGFDTAKVWDMRCMFEDCLSLVTIYVSDKFVTTAVRYSADMFSGCSSLVGGAGTRYDSFNPSDKTYARIDCGRMSDSPGYFTERQKKIKTIATGAYASLDLVKALGIEIPDVDYAAGDKVTVKVEGLAKGLKVVATPVYVDPEAKKKVIKDYAYTIEGVPTEAVDFNARPMYARVTTTYKDKTKGVKGKVESLQLIELSVVTPEPSVLTAGVLNEVYEPVDIAELWPEVADAKDNPKDWSFKGWPTGIKYNNKVTDVNWSYKSSDGKSYGAIAVPYTVYGQPTKAGVFPITATWKHKLDDDKTTVSETFSAVLTIWGDDGTSDFRYTDQAYGAAVDETIADAKSVSGLPTGLKFDKTTGQVTGTPTKPGDFVVTVTKKDNEKETFLWKVAEGENPGLGAAQVGWGDALVKYDGAETRTATLLQGLAADFAVDASALAAGAKVTVSGLPSGLKYDAKTGKITGVATKAEKKVVTVKVVQNGVTVTKTFAIDVVANPFAGAYYGAFQKHVATAVITPAAGGTAKLVLDEYVPSKHKVVKYTATAKGFSMAEEYDPENSLYAGIVYEFTLKADTKNNPDFSAAERVLEVGLTGVSLGQGVVLGLGEVSLRAKDDPPSESGFSGQVYRALTAADYAMFVEAGMKPPPVMAGIARDKAGRHLFSGAAVLDETKLRYQVTGKLRDGTAVKVLQPLCWFEYYLGAPSLFVEKGGDRRANVAMFVGFGELNDDIGTYEYESVVQFLSAEGVSKGEFNPFDTVSIHGTAAEEIGLLDQLLVLDEKELAAAGFEGEAPVFRFRVEEAFDLSKAKINIFAPDAKEGDQPLKSLSPVKLTASSGYVFKGSFKWNANVGGDGNTYSFELVPGLGFDESFLGRCEVKPASGASTVVTARLVPEIE